MFRRRGENLHFIYVFLFLTVALFFLEHQDEGRFAQLFSFERDAFLSGQWWRILTYQFTQAGEGGGIFPKPVFLFFTLLILYFMGAALEEEWGTRYFVSFFLVSTVVTAALAAFLGVPVLGSYFVRYTLLFAYAAGFPEQTFYLFAVLPVRVRWLAYITAGVLLYGVLFGGRVNVAVAGGALAGFVYFLLHRTPAVVRRPKAVRAAAPSSAIDRPASVEPSAARNAGRFVEMQAALQSGSAEAVEQLAQRLDREVVQGVNICPPPDYKPAAADGYCLRCEGFAECSARFLRSRPPAEQPRAASSSG